MVVSDSISLSDLYGWLCVIVLQSRESGWSREIREHAHSYRRQDPRESFRKSCERTFGEDLCLVASGVCGDGGGVVGTAPKAEWEVRIHTSVRTGRACGTVRLAANARARAYGLSRR